MSAFRINYNAGATTALNAVNSTSQKLNDLQKQLSTGLRINTAADDPAGLIKSEIFKTQISGVNQARANTQEAINYLRTADAQMNEITSLLQEARRFTLQASQTGTMDDDQRTALNAQLQNAVSAINNTAVNSTYGNKKILDGTAGITATSLNGNTDYISFTGKFNGQAITTKNVTGSPMIATLTGTVTYATGATTVANNGTITITGPVGTGTGINYTSATTTATALAAAIDAQFATTGVHAAYNGTAQKIILTTAATGSTATISIADSGSPSAIGTNTTAAGFVPVGRASLSLTTKATAATVTGTAQAGYTALTSVLAANSNITINGTFIGSYTTSNTIQNIVSDINNKNLGITASLDAGATTINLVSNKMGSNQSINLIDTGGAISGTVNQTQKGVDAVAKVTLGSNTVTFDKGSGTLLRDADGNEINLTTAGNNLTLNNLIDIGQLTIGSSLFCVDPSNSQTLNISIPDCSPASLGQRAVSGKSLANINLTTPESTNDALKVIDQAIKDVINRRSVLGSIQKNTLESALRSLSVSQENLQASESDIRNLDFADAITQVTRLNILTQSGMAQLAQANQAPQIVLNLLKP